MCINRDIHRIPMVTRFSFYSFDNIFLLFLLSNILNVKYKVARTLRGIQQSIVNNCKISCLGKYFFKILTQKTNIALGFASKININWNKKCAASAMSIAFSIFFFPFFMLLFAPAAVFLTFQTFSISLVQKRKLSWKKIIHSFEH